MAFRGCSVALVGMAATLASLISSGAFAQGAPDTLRHYQFLPRHSVLNETGGIYPRDIDYRVMGTFDFVTRWTPVHPRGIVREAQFLNVDAWASHPILAYVLPLDRVLNLSGLEGRQLPTGAPFDVFAFKGTTQDGSSVELYAAQLGPWLRLRGGTTPPVGSADMLTYKIRALARLAPMADFNGDDAVDGADLATWSSRFGATASGAAPASIGGGDSAPLNGADFLAWQRQVGEEPPLAALDAAVDAAIALAASSSVTAVPEPSALALLAAAVVSSARLRRRAAARSTRRY